MVTVFSELCGLCRYYKREYENGKSVEFSSVVGRR
jgi:hypothetical protein